MPARIVAETALKPVSITTKEKTLQKWRHSRATAGAVGAVFLVISAQPIEARAGERIGNHLDQCDGRKNAILAVVSGIKASQGTMRIQSYRATKSDWLRKGQWLKRIEVSAHAPSMRICIPVDGPGDYAIAVRHDINGNGKTDITKDGGGMSKNPPITIWNLGKPSYRKVSVAVSGLREIHTNMRYM
ncbi:DUF2141 domain-containing protein [Novosphingobium sp. FGD1]|uniref:DUF2141 domain-containing protein n=1 Tax=Novosphingobium silvae TaxID=2692619 RepID=A0A7X4GKM2_9SPHN|nr:DUF2141 domain-containing protein [Novosphingobium silvae]MYL99467.1 DUF2141 domain-containing protein [Novosphingobium silvae]